MERIWATIRLADRSCGGRARRSPRRPPGGRGPGPPGRSPGRAGPRRGRAPRGRAADGGDQGRVARDAADRRRLGRAREHAHVADGVADLGLRVAVDGQARELAAARRRQAHGLVGRGERLLEDLELVVDGAGELERLVGRVGVAALEGVGDALEHVGELGQHHVGGAADLAHRVARGRRSARTTSATATPISAEKKREKLDWPAGMPSVASREALTAAWVTRIWPAPNSSAATMLSPTTDRHGDAAGADEREQQVGDEDADRDAEGQLHGAGEVLAARRAEGDHGGDRREVRAAAGRAGPSSHARPAATEHCRMNTSRVRTRSSAPARPAAAVLEAAAQAVDGAHGRRGASADAEPPDRPLLVAVAEVALAVDPVGLPVVACRAC